ncbi:MAG: hybrid sensor histidine kinase/response regulator, partial [Methylococcaceae bacterium]
PAVRIAHGMEDVLVAAGAGRVALPGRSIDCLLGALDWMMAMAAMADDALAVWLEQHTAEADEWVVRIAACLTLPETGAAAGQATQPTVVSVATAPPAEPASNLAAPSAPVASTDPAIAARPATASDATDPTVKMTAESLGQMLAYAADMLLEARKIEAIATEFQQFRRLYRQLATVARAEQTDSAMAASLTTLLAEAGAAVDQHELTLAGISNRSNLLAERLHNLVLRSRMRPFSDGIQGFPRMVRDVVRQLGKQVELALIGQATLVDRDILSRLDAPLNHLVRNALDHGLERPEQRLAAGKPAAGRLQLAARHQRGRLLISVSDDGQGIDVNRLRAKIIDKGLVDTEMAQHLSTTELYDFLFLPGLTTRSDVTEISGRGVGLDVVQSMVHGCGGSISVHSEPGQGTRFELQLPVTRSVIRALLVKVAGRPYAMPLARIDRTRKIESGLLEAVNGSYYYAGEQGNTGVMSARRVLGLDEGILATGELAIVLIGAEGRQYALVVDELCGEYDMVVRPLDPRLGKVPNFSAVSLDQAGQPVLIMDIDDLIRTADRLFGTPQAPRSRRSRITRRPTKRLLVVDDSITVREVERKLLENAGYEVEVAIDGVDGWNQLSGKPFDLIVSDVDMPRMNGIELVTRIKADPRLSSLPVIIVSYKDRAEDRLRGMAAGADYYLTKSSFHDASLIQAVRDLIGDANEA